MELNRHDVAGFVEGDVVGHGAHQQDPATRTAAEILYPRGIGNIVQFNTIAFVLNLNTNPVLVNTLFQTGEQRRLGNSPMPFGGRHDTLR